MSLYINGDIPRLLETLGAGRLVFGTGMPFKYPGPALLKLEKMHVSEEERAMIGGGNAEGLVGVA
jgi:predicted TIM-barrel fold metal-dependent hydrolase